VVNNSFILSVIAKKRPYSFAVIGWINGMYLVRINGEDIILN